MKKLTLFSIFLLFLVQTSSAQTIYTITVQDNGNALWVIEKQQPLMNQSEIDDWEAFIKNAIDPVQKQKDVGEFRASIENSILAASEYSHRTISAENFDVSYGTVKSFSGSFGVIKYSFTWKNFARTDSGTMLIGDAFSEGMVLTKDNVIAIEIPGGYEVQSTSPQFDRREGSRIIWDGAFYHSFARGEPSVVLVRSGDTMTSIAVIVVILAIISSVYFYFWKKKRDQPPSTPRENMTVAQDAVPLTQAEELKYDESIVQLLKKKGGEAFQSDIVQEIGLSKSKVSIVLAEMKEKGTIIKVRKGKENLIRLAGDKSG